MLLVNGHAAEVNIGGRSANVDKKTAAVDGGDTAINFVPRFARNAVFQSSGYKSYS